MDRHRACVACCLRGRTAVGTARSPHLPECERAIVSLDGRNRTRTKHDWLFDPDACVRADRPLEPKGVDKNVRLKLLMARSVSIVARRGFLPFSLRVLTVQAVWVIKTKMNIRAWRTHGQWRSRLRALDLRTRVRHRALQSTSSRFYTA
jgi:hypothetical protein